MQGIEAIPAAPRPDPMQTHPVAVRSLVRETHDTFTLDLDVADRPGGFPFRPGQFNMLYMYGLGEAPISISGDPARPEHLLHTIRAVGSVTQALQRLRRGDTLGVRGPYGSAWPLAEVHGKNVILLGGGIGLPPLRPAIYHILRHRSDYERVLIFYGARTAQDILYPRELEKWRGRFDVTLLVSVDRGGPEWRGYVGVVTQLVSRVRFEPADTVALICGPEVMIRFAVRELQAHGMADTDIWVSLERDMRCGVGLCGHCQLGPTFVCRDGPVYRFDRVAPLLGAREV